MEDTTGIIRNADGTFPEGTSGNPAGRPPDTFEQKIEKKAVKQLVREYKESLAEALEQIKPVLIAEALKGNVPAIKEIHDRAMDKPAQAITGGEEGSMPFTVVIKQMQDGENNQPVP